MPDAGAVTGRIEPFIRLEHERDGIGAEHFHVHETGRS